MFVTRKWENPRSSENLHEVTGNFAILFIMYTKYPNKYTFNKVILIEIEPLFKSRKCTYVFPNPENIYDHVFFCKPFYKAE